MAYLDIIREYACKEWNYKRRHEQAKAPHTGEDSSGWLPLAIGLAWAIPCTYGYATGFFG